MPRARSTKRVIPKAAEPKSHEEIDSFVKLMKFYRVCQAYFYFAGFITTVIVSFSFAKTFIPIVMSEISFLSIPMIAVFFLRELLLYLVRLDMWGLWISVGMIAYVHLLHAEIAMKMPTKRYKMVQKNLKPWVQYQMLVVGFGCVLFVKSTSALLNCPLDLKLACEEMKDVSTPQLEPVCINLKNLFILFSVLVVTMWEFFHKKMFANYEIKFLNLDNKLFEHIKFYIFNTWKVPFVQSLILLPLCFLMFRFQLEFIQFVWKDNSSELYTAIEWEKSVDLVLIAKTLLWCSVALNMFLYQWVCFNFMLVQRPNFPLEMIEPDNNTILLKEALSSKDTYLKAIGFFDLMIMAGVEDPKLSTIFDMSRTKNLPHNWIDTIDQCLANGMAIQYKYDKYIFRNTDKEREHNVMSLPNVPVPRSFSGSLTIIRVLRSWIKTRLSWSYWISHDPQLVLSNLFSDHFILTWIVDAIVDTISFAVYRGFSSIIQHDLFRITVFIIDTHKRIKKLGEAICNVQSKMSRANIERTSLTTNIETHYWNLQSSIRSSVVQFSTLINEHYEVLTISEEMRTVINQIADGEI